MTRTITTQVRKSDEALRQGDLIQLSITLEVDTGNGKAWVKYGTESSVQPGETTRQAETRVESHVRQRIDEIIESSS